MEKLRNDLPGTRLPTVGYGFEIPTAGTFTGFPHGIVPWDGDFGAIVKQPLADAKGLDKSDFLSLYELAMSDWLGNVFTVGGNRLPVVFASPKQAFSSYWYALPQVLKARFLQGCGGGGPDSVSDSTPPPPTLSFAKYPLPFISFSRTGMESTTDSNPMPLRNIKYLDDDRTKTAWSKYPALYQLTFQVSVWSKYRAMHNWLFSLMDSAFSQGLGYLFTPNQLLPEGEPLINLIQMKGFDETKEDATDDTETIFRWVFTLSVAARRFYELRSAPVAQDFSIGVTAYGQDAGSHSVG